jgi:hypothetical protein
MREKRDRKTSSKLAYQDAQDAQWEAEKKKAASRPKKKSKKAAKESKAVVQKVIYKAAPKVKPPKLKKALSPYQLFAKAMQEHVQADYPDATLGERSKIIGEFWVELPPERKVRWVSLATKDKSRFERESAALA